MKKYLPSIEVFLILNNLLLKRLINLLKYFDFLIPINLIKNFSFLKFFKLLLITKII